MMTATRDGVRTATAAERHTHVPQDEQRLRLLDAASNQGGPSPTLHRKISLATRLVQSGPPEAHGRNGLGRVLARCTHKLLLCLQVAVLDHR